jgi:hypothetical protein
LGTDEAQLHDCRYVSGGLPVHLAVEVVESNDKDLSD